MVPGLPPLPFHLLCLNTAIDQGGVVAIFKILSEKEAPLLLEERFLPTHLKQAQTLMPAIIDALQQAGLKAAEIKAIALTIGPGSFTGIRIGLATAHGFSLPLDIPLIGLSTLTVMNMNASTWIEALMQTSKTQKAAEGRETLVVCPWLDARKNEIYGSVFEWSLSGKVVADTNIIDVHARPQDFLQSFIQVYLSRKNDAPLAFLFLGEGAQAYRADIHEFMTKNAHNASWEIWDSRDKWFPQSKNMASLALQRLCAQTISSLQTLQPIYPRPISEEFLVKAKKFF